MASTCTTVLNRFRKTSVLAMFQSLRTMCVILVAVGYSTLQLSLPTFLSLNSKIQLCLFPFLFLQVLTNPNHACPDTWGLLILCSENTPLLLSSCSGLHCWLSFSLLCQVLGVTAYLPLVFPFKLLKKIVLKFNIFIYILLLALSLLWILFIKLRELPSY